MMGPLELMLGYMLLRGSGAGGGADAGGWKQLAPNAKGQYSVPAGVMFVVDIVTSSPVAPLLTKQIADMGGQVLPPTAAVTQMPVDWPRDDEARTLPGRMRGVAKGPAAIDMGAAPSPVRVWVKP